MKQMERILVKHFLFSIERVPAFEHAKMKQMERILVKHFLFSFRAPRNDLGSGKQRVMPAFSHGRMARLAHHADFQIARASHHDTRTADNFSCLPVRINVKAEQALDVVGSENSGIAQ